MWIDVKSSLPPDGTKCFVTNKDKVQLLVLLYKDNVWKGLPPDEFTIVKGIGFWKPYYQCKR